MGRRDTVSEDYAQFKESAAKLFGDLLQPGKKVVLGRAPARLDVMGGIADYCGSLVLEMPLRQATIVGLQRRRDRRLVARSIEAGKEGLARDVEVSLDDLRAGRGLKSYREVSSLLRADPGKAWAAYVFGLFYGLEKEGICEPFKTGATLCISSTVPFGAGIASSASLEVSALFAILAAYGIKMDGLEAARLAQRVENRVVGAPCGIMDQVTAVLGRERRLLALRCQPHDVEGTIRIPSGTRFVGIDSGVKHAVGGLRYTQTRVGAFMGHKIIFSKLRTGTDPYQGYLARITPDEYARRFRKILPARLLGSEFLKRYGETADRVTQVEPDRLYAVRSRVEHPIYENRRVERFRKILEESPTGDDMRAMIALGKLMYASHWSYSYRCGLGSRETDLLVKLVRRYGPRHGLFGAKITGGGCGGTVAVLAAEGTDDTLLEIMARYAERTGRTPVIFSQNSPGVVAGGMDSFVP